MPIKTIIKHSTKFASSYYSSKLFISSILFLFTGLICISIYKLMIKQNFDLNDPNQAQKYNDQISSLTKLQIVFTIVGIILLLLFFTLTITTKKLISFID
jgi:hypothetical protein